MMAIVSQGDLASSASEQTLVEDFTNGAFRLELALTNMIAGDTIEVRMYTKVRSTGTGNTYGLAAAVVTYTGAQTVDHVVPFDWREADVAIKYTLIRTAGTDRSYPWKVRKLS